ncbi:MAG: tyrosine-type recombinase/integrase [Cyanobacteria bacterium]|nr:tyrosine-type recombinase/integrase [Cyanobacteriota bacterium]
MDITPINNNGSIRIRFKFEGTRYNINPRAKYSNPIDIARAKLVCSKIELDILLRNFDTSLKRYTEDYPHHETLTEKTTQDVIKKVKTSTLIEVWDLWVDSLNISEDTKLNHYRPVRRMIVKVKPQPSLDCSKWLLKSSESHKPSTYNVRLRLLRSCLVWAMKQGLATVNPYLDLKKRKIERSQIKPFTVEEMKTIINGFEENKPVYKYFVTFLFLTGCRPSEGIGIQWKRIDFDRGEITIADSLPQTRTGIAIAS